MEWSSFGLDHNEFKTRLKEIYKPQKFKLFNVGHKYANSLHSQLRMKRSPLNSHLHPIGLSLTPVCQCGKLESVKHFLIDCDIHAEFSCFPSLMACLKERSAVTPKQICVTFYFLVRNLIYLKNSFITNSYSSPFRGF